MAMTKFKTYFLLISIIILGLFLRVYNINNTPPGIYPDEAVNGMSALTAETTGHYKWFYSDNNGREGLFINLIAFSFKFFGVSILTLKLTSIIFGTLAIWGIYLLGKELFKSEQIGLLSAFLMSVSFWSLNFSRIAFRAIMIPAILAFSFYFLFRGVRTKKWAHFAIGGFIFGLGLHTYIAFRVTPLILIIMLLVLILSKKNFLKEYWSSIVIFLIFSALSASPMLYTFFIAHPEDWASRTSGISILNPAVNHGHFFTTFAKTFSLSLAKYNFWGDQNWRQNFPPYGILSPITGIAFLFGIIYSFIKFFHLLTLRIIKRERHSQLEVYTFLLATFFIMLIPEFLANEGNPHALRSIGTLPVVFIFSAVTFNFLFQRIKRHPSLFFKKMATALIVITLIFIGLFNTIKYHFVWTKKIETARAFDKNLLETASFLKNLPPSQEKFIVTGSMGRIPIKLLDHQLKNVFYIYPSQLQFIQPKNNRDFIIIMTDKKDRVIKILRQRFPQLKFKEKKDRQGLSFYILIK